jgi:hypothetical protein
MTRISMKALLGASSVAVIAAISLTPAAHAQGQPGYTEAMPPQPGMMPPAGQPGMAPPPGYGPQQNAYLPPVAGTSDPNQFHQVNTRYPGPKLN